MKHFVLLISIFYLHIALASPQTPFEHSLKIHLTESTEGIILMNLEIDPEYIIYTENLSIKLSNPQLGKIYDLEASPQISFFDRLSQKNRSVLKGKATLKGKIRWHLEPFSEQSISLTFQSCTLKICHFPKTITISSHIERAGVKESFFSFLTLSSNIDKKNIIFTLLIVLIAGLLTSLTPCIAPLVPLTISIFRKSSPSKASLILSSSIYILGLCLTFSFLGVISGLYGRVLGELLSYPAVSLTLSLILFTLALSLFDFFEIKFPQKLNQYFLSRQTFQSYFGKFTSGMLAGLISSSCLSPVLFSVLTHVSTTKNVTLGFLLLFFFSFGFGIPLFILSLSPFLFNHFKKIHFLTPWIKFVLGLCIIFVSFHYTASVLGESVSFYILSIALMLVGILFYLKEKKMIEGGILLILALIVFSVQIKEYLSGDTSVISWKPFTMTVLEKKQNKPSVINFHADWCFSCKKLEKTVFSNKKLSQYKKSIHWLEYDATHISDRFLRVKKHFKIQGLPLVVFIDSRGKLVEELTLLGVFNYEDLSKRLDVLLDRHDEKDTSE